VYDNPSFNVLVIDHLFTDKIKEKEVVEKYIDEMITLEGE